MPGIYDTPATSDPSQGGVLGRPLRVDPAGSPWGGIAASFADPLLLAEVLRWMQPLRQLGLGEPPLVQNGIEPLDDSKSGPQQNVSGLLES